MITDDFADSAAIGSAPPAFALLATDGRTVRLADFAGRPLVVVFTCNHCPYVIGWEARLQELVRTFGDRVGFVGINANDAVRYPDDSFARMQDRATKGLPYPYLHDATQATARAWGAKVTPDFFVLDAQHRLAYRGRLDASAKDVTAAGTPYLRLAIEAVLAGHAPAAATTAVEGCSVKWFL
ncbi:MAG: thioredoxin family protein [Myxococcales bacterium]|nr:thioredoxin family protein [Myxococcales bacterium]